jgi:DNA-binding NarL/FixJ family response regulator
MNPNQHPEEVCRLILVDDHQMFLDGLELILASQPGLHILATARDGFSALSEIETHRPDVVLTDLNMPGMDGLELVKRLKAKFPEIKILVLSMMHDKETVSNIMEVEAEGFILKDSNKSDLVKAIRAIHSGETYYSNEIMNIMLSKYQTQIKRDEAKHNLTTRELEILKLIAQELTSEKIGDKLFISPRTVETHRKNILAKTHSTTLIGLLKYAVRNGLVAFE